MTHQQLQKHEAQDAPGTRFKTSGLEQRFERDIFHATVTRIKKCNSEAALENEDLCGTWSGAINTADAELSAAGRAHSEQTRGVFSGETQN